MSLAVCVLARNEAEWLPRCLGLIVGKVDELVVLDTGSTDATQQLAAQYGATVVHYSWNHDFSEARNYALSQIRSDNVFFVDADEIVLPNTIDAVRAALVEAEAVRIPIFPAVSITDTEPSAGVEPVWSLRGMRRHAQWIGEAGESVELWAAKHKTTEVTAGILHLGAVRHPREAMGRDARLWMAWEKRVNRNPSDCMARAQFAQRLEAVLERVRAEEEMARAWDEAGAELRQEVGRVRLRWLMERLDWPEAIRLATQLQNSLENDPEGRWLLGRVRCEQVLAEADLVRRHQLLTAAEFDFLAALEGTVHARASLVSGATGRLAASFLGQVRLALGDFTGALEAFQRFPDDLDAQIGAVETRIRLGDIKSSLGAIQALLPIGGADVWVIAALAADMSGHPSERQSFLERVREFGFSQVKSGFRRFTAFGLDARQRLVLPAVGQLDRWANGPSTAAAWIEDGERAFGNGDVGAAFQAFVMATRLDPFDAIPWNNLGVLLHSLGQAERAIGALEFAERLQTGHRDSQLNLANILEARGEYERAIPRLRDLAARYPTDTEIQEKIENICSVKPKIILVAPVELPERIRKPFYDLAQQANVGVVEIPTSLVDAAGPSFWLQLGIHRVIWTGAIQAAPLEALIANGGRVFLYDPDQISPLPSTIPRLPLDPEAAIGILGAMLESVAVPATPWVSVIVPTYQRRKCLINLLDLMTVQDLHPALFEVIVADDGSAESVEDLALPPRPFQLTVLRQENAGPACARNLALKHARGRFIVIYNDDALPAIDNLRRHLAAQLASPIPRAILGTFDFTPEMLQGPFTQLMQQSMLLFEYQKMRPHQPNSWHYFYTCNISLPKESLEAVGYFDESFPDPICEDVECGYRLQKIGVMTWYHPEIRAWHDHDMDARRYWRRQFQLGVNTYRLYKTHNDPSMIASQSMPLDDNYFTGMQMLVGKSKPTVSRLQGYIERLERQGLLGEPGTEHRNEMMKEFQQAVFKAYVHHYHWGLSSAHASLSWRQVTTPKRLHEQLMSVIIANLNGVPHLYGTIESFRQTNTGPAEMIVVDNGSTDGSLEWLREQPDIRLIELGRNLGAPTARNRGLAYAQGETILFSDNDVIFTPRWREILCGHLDLWPHVGVVGPCSDYVVPVQKADVQPEEDEDLNNFAQALHERNRGQILFVPQLILFSMLARREVIEKIGGIDEAFNPWGFEDNDWCLRVKIAGFSMLVAQDCFIKHLGSRTSKTAKIDYGQLLRRNWEVFKRKWDIDPNTPYGAIDLSGPLTHPFDPAKHFVSFRT